MSDNTNNGFPVPEEPLTREEQYLSAIAGVTSSSDIPEKPLTRIEAYLDKIVENGGGGSGFEPTDEQLAAMNSGATTAKIDQIETNKNNISLQQDATAQGGNGYAIINGKRLYMTDTQPTNARNGDKWIDGNIVKNCNIILPDNPICAIGADKDTLNLETGACSRYIKKIVFDGTQTITNVINTTDNLNYCCIFTFSVIGMTDIKNYNTQMSNIDYPVFVSDRFVNKSNTEYANYNSISSGEMGANNADGMNRYIIFCVSGLNTSEDYQTWFTNNPTTLYYILETPTTETVTVPSGLSGTEEGYLIQDGTPTPTAPIEPTANNVVVWS